MHLYMQIFFEIYPSTIFPLFFVPKYSSNQACMLTNSYIKIVIHVCSYVKVLFAGF